MKRDQGYMTRLRGPQPGGQKQHREDQEHRRAVLYLAVVGTMAFVVALWVMVIPVQVSGLRLGGLKRVIANPLPEKTATEQWNDLMTGASERLQKTTDDLSARSAQLSSPPATVAAPLTAAALTARLEAVVASSPSPATVPVPVTSR